MQRVVVGAEAWTTSERFDQKSERLDPDQYELILEEVEATLGRISAQLESVTPERQRSTRRSNRGSLPARLERIEQIVDIEDKACACCGGAARRVATLYGGRHSIRRGSRARATRQLSEVFSFRSWTGADFRSED